MVYLKNLVNPKLTTLLVVGLVLGSITAEVGSTKIAYKKPINGKTPLVKPKSLKLKTAEDETTTTTTPPLPSLETTLKSTTSTTTSSILDKFEAAESTHAIQTIENAAEQHNTPTETNDELKETEQIESTLDAMDVHIESSQSAVTTNSSKEIEEQIVVPMEELPENQLDIQHVDVIEISPIDEHLAGEHTVDIMPEASDSNEHATNTSTEGTNVHSTTTVSSKRPTPCTCGIFMTSQIKRTKNPYEPPAGKPVITNELDRIFPCNAVGQKQCQTKCLESIVQHLPNSANILCATLDRDIRKERAYLYIKNCRNQWYNTNLAAGREYCCKNGQPYQCPLV